MLYYFSALFPYKPTQIFHYVEKHNSSIEMWKNSIFDSAFLVFTADRLEVLASRTSGTTP